MPIGQSRPFANGYCATSTTLAAKPTLAISEQRISKCFSPILLQRARCPAQHKDRRSTPSVFLYKNVMDIPLHGEMTPARSKRLTSPPTVLTQVEVQRLLATMEGKTALMAKLLYGSGLRLMESIRLRVQDVDFGQNLIFIRGGKGGKDRTTMLPQNLRDELQSQINADRKSTRLNSSHANISYA